MGGGGGGGRPHLNEMALLTNCSARPRDFLLPRAHPEYRARIFKLLRSPRIDSKETIPPAYVAWRAVTTTLFLLGS